MTHPVPPSPVLDTRTGYDRWSEIYDVDGNPLVAIEEPEVARHLGPVRGLRIADIGCGTGRHALRLAAAGAEVTALDFSEGMLARAQSKPGAERVRWTRHDLSLPLPLETGSFDRVLCALVLDHVRDLDLLMAELGRISRPARAGSGGRIVLSVMHPAMLLRGVQARFTDPRTGVKTLVQSVPNQISDYVMAAVAAGLRIAHMSEHAPDAALAARMPRAEPYIGWPLLLMMVLER